MHVHLLRLKTFLQHLIFHQQYTKTLRAWILWHAGITFIGGRVPFYEPQLEVDVKFICPQPHMARQHQFISLSKKPFVLLLTTKLFVQLTFLLLHPVDESQCWDYCHFHESESLSYESESESTKTQNHESESECHESECESESAKTEDHESEFEKFENLTGM